MATADLNLPLILLFGKKKNLYKRLRNAADARINRLDMIVEETAVYTWSEKRG